VVDRDVPIAIYRFKYRAGTARSTFPEIQNLLVIDITGGEWWVLKPRDRPVFMMQRAACITLRVPLRRIFLAA
jgi:hypothetical protein